MVLHFKGSIEGCGLVILIDTKRLQRRSVKNNLSSFFDCRYEPDLMFRFRPWTHIPLLLLLLLSDLSNSKKIHGP